MVDSYPFFLFFFKQKTAYEIHERLVGSEMCIRDRNKRRKVHRRLGSSTPGSRGSTTAGPNHSQKKSLILAQKER